MARKGRSYGFLLRNLTSLFKTTSSHYQNTKIFPGITKCDLDNRGFNTLVCDIDSVLIRTPSHRKNSNSFSSFFPYFMLVSFEGGSIVRAFFLLLSCSFLWVLDYELKLRVLTFITFCGLRVKDMENVGRTVLPKFYLENLNLQAYDVWVATGSRFVFTSLPKVMVEGFLKEYLGADGVVGSNLQEFKLLGKKYYTGLVSGPGLIVKHKAVKEYFGEDKKPDLGIGGCSSLDDHLFISFCKEAYVLNKEDIKNDTRSLMVPRERYPKPLVFHDGRLAFLPTPLATLLMFIWLPIGIPLAIFRLFVGIFLPSKLALILGSWSGINIRFKTHNFTRSNNGVLYVCNHRTLLDPVFLSLSLGKPLTAVTYSLSKMSELIAPIKTVRLRRDRKQDGEAMRNLLGEGDLVVCPEGTTCREPYLLRFSPLFAELTEEIVPVAVDTHVGMFYGTTASGLKCLDPIFFLMNPRPVYRLEALTKLPKEMTCAGGKSRFEVANFIQKELGTVLGFECTNLTRKDKYLVLAGNEGIVK